MPFMTQRPPEGLCDRCVHKREIRSDRGSIFHQCSKAFVDPRFPKYPRLPVLRCEGFEPLSGEKPASLE